jgi:hypothetical protein
MALLWACSSVEAGRDFALSSFDAKVEQGITTQRDVRSWLGAPSGVGVSVESNGDRYEQWSYYFAQGHLPSMADARLKFLQIKFDRQGVVCAYNWSGESK